MYSPAFPLSCSVSANALQKVVDKLGLSYQNPRELNNIIDNDMAGPPPFQCRELDIGHENLQFFCRDAIQCVRSLYGDPEFTQHMVFSPERHYTNVRRTCRVVNEMHTGDWWWSVQVCDVIICDNYRLVVSLLGFPGITSTGRDCHSNHYLIRQDTAYSVP